MCALALDPIFIVKQYNYTVVRKCCSIMLPAKNRGEVALGVTVSKLE